MATKSVSWNTGSGNITLTYQGQGNGTITVTSDANDTGSARSQVVAVETIGGAVAKNLTIRQAACPFPVGEVRSYSYTGNYQEVELPAGTYKLQCWGAQGGSNGTYSTYGITAKAGGKGGYSEGVLTLSQKTTVRVYVGGQGSSSSGGYNGGGSTTGTSQYNSGGTLGYSKMGGGGGATDIRLSDGSLYSRMIVAGGGSGGAMCYKSVTTTTTITDATATGPASNQYNTNAKRLHLIQDMELVNGRTYTATFSVPSTGTITVEGYKATGQFAAVTDYKTYGAAKSVTFTVTGNYKYVTIYYRNASGTAVDQSMTISMTLTHTTSSTSTSTESQVGWVGGGSSGGGYSSTYRAGQANGGSGGSFGQGANQTASASRYVAGAGGGGWYGGGCASSDATITVVKYSGGGSGWVNTSASASYRPSGYTGLELDSGTTYDGTVTFVAPSGGYETGHAGNGYAKITRLS